MDVEAAVGGALSVGGTECTDNPLALEGMAELEDGILPIGMVVSVSMVVNGCGGGRASLEELFDAAKLLCVGEVGEFGVVGDVLGEDFFFVGDSHHDVVEVAVELVQHCVLASDR